MYTIVVYITLLLYIHCGRAVGDKGEDRVIARFEKMLSIQNEQHQKELRAQREQDKTQMDMLTNQLSSLQDTIHGLLKGISDANKFDDDNNMDTIFTASGKKNKCCIGPAGPPGNDGPQGLAGPPGPAATSQGDTYIRWGRTTCEGVSSLIYEGWAGSSYYAQGGGGVNYQCMPWVPEDDGILSNTQYIAVMYGAEYESQTVGAFPDSAQNQNVPCARCYTNTRPATMMIPAKQTCPAGWTLEYQGYLMTAYHDHGHPATFECVDKTPEYIPGHQVSTNGALFYFVIPDCNVGVPCPNYVESRLIMCVVCSK